MYVRLDILAHASMSLWNGALFGCVSGWAKSHSMEQRRTITFARGLVIFVAGRLHWYLGKKTRCTHCLVKCTRVPIGVIRHVKFTKVHTTHLTAHGAQHTVHSTCHTAHAHTSCTVRSSPLLASPLFFSTYANVSTATCGNSSLMASAMALTPRRRGPIGLPSSFMIWSSAAV